MKNAVSQIVEPVREAQPVLLDFGSHRSGEHSVAVIYDENGNGELDTGLLGIPKEKVALPNNAKGRLGAAKWENRSLSLEGFGSQLGDNSDTSCG
jgi:uncharacterized protein (DUF2141 family)